MWAQTTAEVAVATSGVEATPRARFSLLVLAVPVLVVIAMTAVALAVLAQGLMDGHDCGGFDHATPRGLPLGGAGDTGPG